MVDQVDIYSVMVIDVNGCIVIVDVMVEEYFNFILVIDGFLSFCVGFNIILGMEENYVFYLWLDNSIDLEFIVDMFGDVVVMVMDSNGCIGLMVEMVELVDGLSLVIVGLEGFCFGELIVLCVVGNYVIISWLDGSGVDIFVVDSLGVYVVLVMDNGGCVGENVM